MPEKLGTGPWLYFVLCVWNQIETQCAKSVFQKGCPMKPLGSDK
jgi:hypothetical protein